MSSMFSYERKNAGWPRRRTWALLPALALGTLVGLLPAESQAAPTCTSKPAVCDRLAAAKKQTAPTLLVQAQPGAPVAGTPATSAVARNSAPTCSTKPAVCARLDARGTRAAAAPVTLASSAAAGPRCSSKPAVCARLRVRPTAPPITLATTASETR
jgi:hypothetical protein